MILPPRPPPLRQPASSKNVHPLPACTHLHIHKHVHIHIHIHTQVLDELRHLEDFFTSQNRQARQPMVGLYEQAQACTMVLPRLYLLNTVGACYILSKEAPAKVRFEF